ncbi:MAG: hypothetical protein U5M50_06765 [Sphingobium sp.]|nr:hypothetical protein [Sphingobium sp.]
MACAAHGAFRFRRHYGAAEGLFLDELTAAHEVAGEAIAIGISRSPPSPTDVPLLVRSGSRRHDLFDLIRVLR